MKFGPVPVANALNTILAHSLSAGDLALGKGRILAVQDISGMGMDGLPRDIPTRPQPRRGASFSSGQPGVEILLLAAGSSSRMEGGDKLLEDVDGMPMLRHAAQAAMRSDAAQTHVILQPHRQEHRKALGQTGANLVFNPLWQEGMAASIRAGMAAISENCGAVIIALADMPDITADHFNRLIATFAPNNGREICRAIDENGVGGLPVLFGARFFESLTKLRGDRGAKGIWQNSKAFVTEVATGGLGATTDLDSPDAWENWRKNRAGA